MSKYKFSRTLSILVLIGHMALVLTGTGALHHEGDDQHQHAKVADFALEHSHDEQECCDLNLDQFVINLPRRSSRNASADNDATTFSAQLAPNFNLLDFDDAPPPRLTRWLIGQPSPPEIPIIQRTLSFRC